MVVKEIGFYANKEEVGWEGWIKTIDGDYFIGLDGKIMKASIICVTNADSDVEKRLVIDA